MWIPSEGMSVRLAVRHLNMQKENKQWILTTEADVLYMKIVLKMLIMIIMSYED
jgi:hypothetical protein